MKRMKKMAEDQVGHPHRDLKDFIKCKFNFTWFERMKGIQRKTNGIYLPVHYTTTNLQNKL